MLRWPFLWHDFISTNKKAVMKKITQASLSAVFLFLVACSNQASDNAGSNDSTGSTQNSTDQNNTSDTRTNPPATPPQEYSAPPSKAKADDVVKEDTSKTSVSVGKNGASVKTKKGTNVSYDKSGIKLDKKDVKIDIKRDSL
jgi:hypothetical protein